MTLALLARRTRFQPIAQPLTPILAFQGSGIADFRTTVGGADRFAVVPVHNDGNGSLGVVSLGAPTYPVGTPDWLQATYDSGTGEITLQAVAGGMPAGRHEAFLPVSATLAVNGTQSLFAVFQVDPVATPQLTLTPSTRSQTAQQGGSNPAPLTSIITNTGGGSLGTLGVGTITTISGSQPHTAWLSVNIVGTTININFTTGSLTELGGPYVAEVEITASALPSTPSILTVFFNISNSQSTATYLGANLPVGDQQILHNPVTKQFDNTVMITGGESFTGAVHSPADANALRSLLNGGTVQNGDQIRLTPGAFYDSTTGSPIQWCAGLTNYVSLRTGTLSGFPARGTRISGLESYATIRTSNLGGSGSAALHVPGGRGYLMAQGVRFTQHPSQTAGFVLVQLGNELGTAINANGLAHRCQFVHCFFDVRPARDNASQFMRGCMDMEATYVAIEDSILGRFHAGQDAYTLRACDGTGPFKFINLDLMSSCVGWLTGGSSMSFHLAAGGGGPQNWEMRRCYSHKDPTKKGVTEAGALWNAKNLGEFKNMRRALITDMVFQYHWGQGQVGHFLAFTNYDGTGAAADDEHCSDIVVAYCHAMDVGAGVQYLNNNNRTGRHGRNVLSHILMQRVNVGTMTTVPGLSPRIIALNRGTGKSVCDGLAVRNLTVDCPTAHSFLFFEGPNGPIHTDGDVQNNICHHGSFGAFFTWTGGNPGAGIDLGFTNQTFDKNVILASGNSALWPNGGTTFASRNVIGVAPSAVFTLYPSADPANYAVPTTSGGNNWGTDGNDPGCDIPTLLTKTAHCIDGDWN